MGEVQGGRRSADLPPEISGRGPNRNAGAAPELPRPSPRAFDVHHTQTNYSGKAQDWTDLPLSPARSALAVLPPGLLLISLCLPPWWAHWPLALGVGMPVLLWGGLVWACAGVRPCSRAVTALAWLEADRFALALGSGRRLHARLLPGAFVHPRLLALRFRGEDGRVYRLLYPAASRERQRLRPLRVLLLHRSRPAAAPASPSA